MLINSEHYINFVHAKTGLLGTCTFLSISEIIGKMDGLMIPSLVIQSLQCCGYLASVSLAIVTIYFKIKLKK